MGIIQLFVVLIIIGVISWAAINYIPMTNGIKTLIKVVAIVFACLIILQAFGLTDGINNIHLHKNY
jgi:hypothetical protein